MPAPVAVASTWAPEASSTSSTEPRHRMPGCIVLSITCGPSAAALACQARVRASTTGAAQRVRGSI